MRIFLARLNADQDNQHEIVGIFAARSFAQLYDLIDECTDVGRVEVIETGWGGLYWGAAVEYRLPYEGDVDLTPSLPGDATFSETWLRYLFNRNEREWRAVAEIDFDDDLADAGDFEGDLARPLKRAPSAENDT